MTGRRMYEIYCNAYKAERQYYDSDLGKWTYPTVPKAWPFIGDRERSMWNAMAKRVKGVRR